MSEPAQNRPSKLELDRYATGELSETEAHSVESRLDDRARAHLSAVELAKQQVPPLNVGELRRRASAMTVADNAVAGVPAMPPPANNNRLWLRLGPVALVLAAALALFWIGPLGPGPDSAGPDLGTVRSGDVLVAYQASEGQLRPYTGTPVGEGDVLGFQVLADGHTGVVLLSVDGYGTVTVFYPASGNDPVSISGLGMVPVEGTVALDNAPGPEVFVAMFDRSVEEATEELRQAYASGSHVGLLRWAQTADGVAAVKVVRR